MKYFHNNWYNKQGQTTGIIPAMRIRLIYTLIMLYCLTCPAIAETPQPEKWTNQETWQTLQKGMTEQQVIRLLGKPIDKETTAILMIWYYQTASEFVGVKVTSRPEYGFVRFKRTDFDRRSRTPIFTVFKWKEPDWLKVQAELEAKEHSDSLQKQNERIKQRQIEIEKQRQIEIEKQRQIEIEKQRQIEIEKQGQIQPENRKSSQPASQKKEGFNFSGFVYIGIVILFLAFLLTVFFRKSLH